MAYKTSFKGCKTFIHAVKSEMLTADASIIEYDKSRLTIIVSNPLTHFKDGDKVTLLILEHSALYEFGGTIRKNDNMGNREIALFHGKIKESRKATRYTINAEACVEKLIIGQKLIPLLNPNNVEVVNISQSGILVRAGYCPFNIGTSFQVKMEINGMETVLNAHVKRMKPIENGHCEYGCTLIGKG